MSTTPSPIIGSTYRLPARIARLMLDILNDQFMTATSVEEPDQSDDAKETRKGWQLLSNRIESLMHGDCHGQPFVDLTYPPFNLLTPEQESEHVALLAARLAVSIMTNSIMAPWGELPSQVVLEEMSTDPVSLCYLSPRL